MIGFQEKTVFELHERRKREKEKSVTNYDIVPYVVERQNVFIDLLKIYVENADITTNILSIRFIGPVAWWLATCARKSKVPGTSPAISYAQR